MDSVEPATSDDAARAGVTAHDPLVPNRGLRSGDAAAAAQALGWDDVHLLLGEARAMARRLLRSEAHADSLPTMALVLTGLRRQKLADQQWHEVEWSDREHFLAAMYRAMERALTDHARRRNALKRAALRQAINIGELTSADLLRTADFQPHDIVPALDAQPQALEALADALALLEQSHPQWAAVARHRYYGGLTTEQTAQLMQLSERTVRRHWEKARVLLHDHIVGTSSRSA